MKELTIAPSRIPTRRIIVVAVFLSMLGAGAAWSVVLDGQWEKDVSSGENYESITDVGATRSHHVAAVGNLSGSPRYHTEGQGFNIYVGSYTLGADVRWEKEFGDSSNQFANALAIDSQENIYVTGSFEGRVNFGGGNLFSAGSGDVYLAKLGDNGSQKWSKRFGDTQNQSGYDVAVDRYDNVYLTGAFQSVIDFGDGPLMSFGGLDVFLVKFNAAGQLQWYKRFGTAGNQVGTALVTSDSTGVYLTGYFENDINLGGGVLTSAGEDDIFLAKFSLDGQHLWSKRFGGIGSQQANAIAIDRQQNVYIAGNFTGTTDFGGGNLVSAGGDDALLATFDKNGTYRWQKRFGDTDDQRALSVCVSFDTDAPADPEHVYITGQFRNKITFGRWPFSSVVEKDIFIAGFRTQTATCTTEVTFGDAENQVGAAVYADQDRIHLGGAFEGKLDFNTALSPELVSGGSYDAFVASFTEIADDPEIIDLADVPNDQGGRLQLTFLRSNQDHPAAVQPVSHYDIYRRSESTQTVSRGRAMARLTSNWDYVATVSADTSEQYVVQVETERDSTRWAGRQYSAYFVRAMTANPVLFFDSQPDSGFSIDNIAPPAPANLSYSHGLLTWSPPSAPDLLLYTVYGSNTNSFSTATQIAQPTAPSLDVSGSPYAYFFVTAWDSAGNEGEHAAVTGSVVGVDDASRYTLSLSSYPNPFNPSTSIRYTLPSRGTVRITVFDAGGGRVTTLVDAVRSAGAYAVGWDGRDDAGHVVGSGIYFARLSHKSGVRNYKLVLLR
jgi:hypothetical protein